MIMELKNRFLSVGFDTNKMKIVSIINLISGDEYIKQENDAEIFELTCIDFENKLYKVYPTKVESAEIIQKRNSETLRVKYLVNDDFKVTTDISISQQSDLLNWSIAIDNNSNKYDIVEILYPRIRGIYLGDTWEDDIIILPHHAGEKTINPYEEYKKPVFKNMWRAGVKEENFNYRELNYCGLASMTWMYYYDKNNGFYISSCDDEFPITALRFETSNDINPWVGFAIRKYKKISRNESWNSKPYIMSINCKDWHWGAKIYRKWIDRYITMPENPEYLKDQCVLMNMYNFKRERQVQYSFSDIPYLFNYAKSFGIDHFFMAGWNRMGFDQNYPEYYPDLELGTSMDLHKGCQYIEDNNGISTFYINTRIFDVKSDYFNTLGKTMAIKDSKGNMIFEKYGDYEFTVSCPSDTLWQKYVIDTATWMIKAYGAKGIYLDQLGSAEPCTCYDYSHSHKDIGEFPQGYLKILKDIKAQINELNQDTFIMIENCGDIYGSYIWGNLTWNGDVRDEFFNLYKYTFPEYVQINMVNPKEVSDSELRKELFYKDIERAVLLGSVLWVNPLTKFDIYNEEDINLLEYLRKAINFRKKLNTYIKECRFVDDEEIISISKNINVTHWVGDNSDVYVIGNKDLKEGFFEVQQAGRVSVSYALECGSNYNYVIDKVDNKMTIQVPQSQLSFIVFEN
ncbi:DUF6259 domain-containing protein [Clostridium swellfunianum]|uniref:DUF6259 domain-containing protein n=1 Tax=Clostridium swellfunianum TaxID=1367462 RepID=UPI00202E8788|nr:DUF6259 domain-containing protein [Clostridium swellfunianum]MCM0646917.1 DUF6259 domain-containing protein [Clostridium swellfunianum]